ncbi:MAG: competence/damage-inducible protein A [Proteobacteria bacterium]|nr:competence/damage-inducible protein A [Pseudomonadota bacterium]MCP4919229.1 competence/damage-inducible protein A [Pseudomonadota bacterium]
MATAAIVIIGNEILTGKFVDENSPYLILRLRELGVELQRIAVIADDHDAIAGEVRRSSDAYDLVFTTGGVGPTHDDITMESIAQGFEVPLVERPELAELLNTKLKSRVNEAALRMAMVPEGSEFWWDGGLLFPLVVKENVHILPGVPSILKLKFEAVAERFRQAPSIHSARVVTREREIGIAARLEEALSRFDVEIGSYPRYDEGPMHVIITIEGRDAAQVQAAAHWLDDCLEPLDVL